MSLARCALCGEIWDTDEFSTGFYVKGHENEYVCVPCAEQNNLEYEI